MKTPYLVVGAERGSAQPASRTRRQGRWQRDVARLLGGVLAILVCGFVFARADASGMAGYLNCARSIGVAIDQRFSILPSDRFGEPGLYFYTAQGAFFLPLGEPHLQAQEAKEYLLSATVPGFGEIYLNYRDWRAGVDGSAQRAIGYQTVPPPLGVLKHYRPTPVRSAQDERAIAALSDRLKERVSRIKEFIDDKNRYSTPAEAKAAFERDRLTYRAKLDNCRLENDGALLRTVAEEVRKLETGFPGATIWEREIGTSGNR